MEELQRWLKLVSNEAEQAYEQCGCLKMKYPSSLHLPAMVDA